MCVCVCVCVCVIGNSIFREYYTLYIVWLFVNIHLFSGKCNIMFRNSNCNEAPFVVC